MELVFERLGDYSEFNIDRKNKTLKCVGENTNYVGQELPWRQLWDKCEVHKTKPNQDNSSCKDCDEVAKKQDDEMKNYSDKKFAQVFINQMEVYGYKIAKCHY